MKTSTTICMATVLFLSAGSALGALYTVEIGTPASEDLYNPVGWGPIEPSTHGGNYGGIATDPLSWDGLCRVIWEKLNAIGVLDDVSPLQVPGNFPYRERRSHAGISPVTREEDCIKCATCAAVCPMAAITVNDTVVTDSDACIRCCACVKNCPTQARVMEAPTIRELAERLSTNFRARKEPETYLVP